MQYILALGGQGKRLWPLTETRPKCLIPVLNRPILDWILDDLKSVTDKLIVIVSPQHKETIQEHFRHRGDFSTKIVVQEFPRGTADIVLTAAPYLNSSDKVFIIYGDVLFPPGTIKNMVSSPDFLAAVTPVEDPRQYGIVRVANGEIVEIIEKPESPPTNLSLTGLFKLPGAIIDAARETPPSPRGELELTDSIQFLIKRGYEIRVYKIEWWFDIGTPWTLLEANAHMLSMTKGPEFDGILDPDMFPDAQIENCVHAHGKVIIKEGTVIRSGTYIIGPVYIGKNCVIGPGAYLRPYTVLGDGVRIGNSCEIKASVLMNDARVPHLSYVGDSIIGEHTNLGCGTITANLRLDEKTVRMMIKGKLVDSGRRKLGAVIGDNVKTGINVNFMPGVKVGNNCMIGPGINVWRDLPSGTTCLTQKEYNRITGWDR